MYNVHQFKRKACVVSSALVLSTLFLMGVAQASGGAIIDNGTIKLGVDNEGNLIVSGVGITYNPTNGEALAPGCDCEGWGVADATSGRFGKAGEAFGYANITLESFTSTATTAKSVVKVVDGGDLVRVTHDFKPSASSDLYQVDVTIENISGAAITDLRYRRVMDWDTPPTEFTELVTLVTGGATNVLFTSDDGFADGNPLAAQTSILFTGEATDSGPADHGALFDFGFGNLANGATCSFTIYYGASSTQANALTALATAGAENVYSLGKPDPANGAVGTDGSPNTFIFGFKGVGGVIIPPPATIPTLSFYGLSLLVMLLSGFGFYKNRKKALS